MRRLTGGGGGGVAGFGLGIGENWTGGRLSGDEVRLVKVWEVELCILTGEVAPFWEDADGRGESCKGDWRVLKDRRGWPERLEDNLVGDAGGLEKELERERAA